MNNIKSKFSKLPVFVLSGFGHSGIDWVHGLLDSHKQILIMPPFSYFRTINIIKHKHKIDIENETSNDEIAKILTNIFYSDSVYKNKKRRFLFNIRQKKTFYKNLKAYLYFLRDKNIYKKIFFAIHFAYAAVYNLNIHKIKKIVIHEHVSMFFTEYEKIFNANFFCIVREPKSVVIGSIKRMKKINKLNSYNFNFLILQMILTSIFFNKKSKKKYILVNEKMHLNLTKEMKKFCKWLNIKFSPILLKETYLGEQKYGETSYLSLDEIKKGIPKSYYHLFNVEKRWQSSGSRKDFLLVDAIFRRTIKKFNYKFYENLDFYRIVCGYLYYFTMYNQQKKYRYTWILHALKNIIRKFFILIFPKLSLKMFGYF